MRITRQIAVTKGAGGMKPFIIDVALYNAQVAVFVRASDSTVREFLQERIPPDELTELIEQIHGCRHSCYEGSTLICDRIGAVCVYLNITEPHVVAHEMLHVCTAILGKRGIFFTEGSAEEAYAYLLSYLVRETLKEIKKQTDEERNNTDSGAANSWRDSGPCDRGRLTPRFFPEGPSIDVPDGHIV